MKYKGEIIAKNQYNDFYLVEQFLMFHVIESSDSLDIGDIIYWDGEDNFFNETQGIMISGIIQYENISYNQGIQVLRTI